MLMLADGLPTVPDREDTPMIDPILISIIGLAIVAITQVVYFTIN